MTKKKPEQVELVDKPIKKIDRTVFEAGRKNGLNIKDTKFVEDILKGEKQGKAYKDNIAKPTTTDRRSIDVKATEKLGSVKIQKTIKDVMVKEKLTNENIIRKHKEIQDQSLQEKDFTNARETNRDFMKLAGMLDNKTKDDKGNTYIQNNIIDVNAIDKLIKAKQAI